MFIRSKLFVPGSRPELFSKAMRSGADAVSFDLEDAVEESRKAEARANIAEFLTNRSTSEADPKVIVRVNAPLTSYFEEDLNVVVKAGVDIVNVPMLEDPEHVRAVAALIEDADGRTKDGALTGILVNIETPRALRRAFDLAQAHPNVMGLQLGFADLFEPLGMNRRNSAAVSQTQFMVRLAAGEAGVIALDSAFANIRDPDGFVAEARASQSLGFAGKTCIHPSQIALANDAFRPSDDEIQHSIKVVAAACEAEKTGTGAFTVDGKMIDPPFVRRAEDVLSAASKLGIEITASE